MFFKSLSIWNIRYLDKRYLDIVLCCLYLVKNYHCKGASFASISLLYSTFMMLLKRFVEILVAILCIKVLQVSLRSSSNFEANKLLSVACIKVLQVSLRSSSNFEANKLLSVSLPFQCIFQVSSVA